MSRRWVYSVEKNCRKLKHHQIRVSLTSHIDALSLLLLHLSSHFFLLPAPLSSEQRPSPPTGSKKQIKKLKQPADTPLLCALCDDRHLSFPFTPAGKLICQTARLRGQPSQASSPNAPSELLPLCEQESSSRLPQHSSRAAQVPSGEGFAWDAVTVTSQNSAPFAICCALLLSQDTKAGEMSVECHRNLAGCSRAPITLLKGIERDPFVCKSSFQIGLGFFYCPVKDSAMSELEIWQLHPSHILTQGRQQMLQEDYISSCTLGLQGDYAFRVKGFKGLALRPRRRIFLFPAKNICKAQGVLPSRLYGVSRKCCSQGRFYLRLCQG